MVVCTRCQSSVEHLPFCDQCGLRLDQPVSVPAVGPLAMSHAITESRFSPVHLAEAVASRPPAEPSAAEPSHLGAAPPVVQSAPPAAASQAPETPSMSAHNLSMAANDEPMGAIDGAMAPRSGAMAANDGSAPPTNLSARLIRRDAERSGLPTVMVGVGARPVGPSAVSGQRLAKLRFKQYGAITDREFTIGDPTIVGRFDRSTGPVDLDLTQLGPADHISRSHARLFTTNGVWMVEDLLSKNGVYIRRGAVAPVRIGGPTELYPGDEVSFGSVTFIFTPRL